MEKTERTRNKRSPNFPSMNLEAAIRNVKKIYDADGRSESLRSTALRHLGYKGENGAARITLSALKKFNLIEETNGNIRLTKAAGILFISEDEEKKEKIIKECALKPVIYNQLWDQYYKTGLPSDASIKDRLIWEYKFNEKSVDKFLIDFRKTLEFANLKAGETIKEDESNEQESTSGDILNEQGMISPDFTSQSKNKPLIKTDGTIIKEYLIPRIGDKLAILKLEKPVLNEDIDLIVKWLELLRSTIVDKKIEN